MFEMPWEYFDKETPLLGSGCGSVGSAVASNTRGPQFDSSHRQTFIMYIFIVNCWRGKNKEAEEACIDRFIKTKFFLKQSKTAVKSR